MEFAIATGVFLATVLLLCVLFVVGVARAGGPGEPAATRRAWTLGAALGVGAWLALTWALAARGALAHFDAAPPGPVRLLVPAALGTVVLAFSPLGTRLARGLSLEALVGFQAFRVPTELFLFWAYRAGLAPRQMTFQGLNYDVVTGVAAVVVAWLAWRGTLPRWLLLAWNALGLALLLNVVTIAVLSMPTPMRVFQQVPAPVFVTQPPFVWLPAVLVMAALLGHVLVFRRLRADRGRA